MGGRVSSGRLTRSPQVRLVFSRGTAAPGSSPSTPPGSRQPPCKLLLVASISDCSPPSAATHWPLVGIHCSGEEDVFLVATNFGVGLAPPLHCLARSSSFLRSMSLSKATEERREGERTYSLVQRQRAPRPRELAPFPSIPFLYHVKPTNFYGGPLLRRVRHELSQHRSRACRAVGVPSFN